MEHKIKQSYEKINISDGAKNRIEMAIVMDDQNSTRSKNVFRTSRVKVAVAACLTLAVVLPTGTFAAEKIYQYYKASVKEQAYHVDMELDSSKEENGQKTKQQYVKLVTDFGSDYTLEKDSDDTMFCYNYKDGFDSGRCFWYELQYVDGDTKQLVSNYDTDHNEVLTINGRKAVYSRTNTIVGSKYENEYATTYGQVLYIFAEEYGYVLELAAQNGMPKDDMIALAKNIKLEKAASKEDASKYALFRERQNSGWNVKAQKAKAQKIDPKHYYTKQADYKNAGFKVKDVKVLRSTAGLKKDAFLANQFDYASLVSKDGTLKKYDREYLKLGDGVSEPEKQVAKTERVQSNLVSITLEVENSAALAVDGKYYVPSLHMVTEKKGSRYDTSFTEQYNRPQVVSNAFVDRMPCYFEEGLGGKSAWATKASNGKITLHLAYLVDEDFTDHLALSLNSNPQSISDAYYLEVSK